MFTRNETLIDKARYSKKLPNLIWALILALIFLNIGSLIGSLITLPLIVIMGIIPYFESNQNLIILLSSLISFIGISLLVFFRVKKIEKRKISSIGFEKSGFFKKYLLGFVIGLILMSIVVLILYLFGFVDINKNPSQPVGIFAISNVSIILIGWIIQGGTEEILTRGWLMNVLSARYNVHIGLFISSVFFGALHLLNPNVNYIAILNIILVGYLFGLYVLKTNDLWGACGIHSAWNFAQGNLFGFEVSGINVSIGSLLDLNLKGNPFISGGNFGPEAGLCSTVVLLLGIILIFYLDKKGLFKKYFNNYGPIYK
ncbi:type II CAAX endopeptidase family protein [Paraclostridium sordellii]|uniref:CPBP family intramembrane glutamic endopeptidase n=1 Tax=Paraclostridium sordellii TaxID=1505 RepID=UPI0005DA7AA5|nr:type II CAAX endopeptidase family protein [Paeniclostridium sordellii]CEP81244.1 CAAX amino terminal protease family protein [[Clostridium] sordellii] [Paeniclostridium sordellii]